MSTATGSLQMNETRRFFSSGFGLATTHKFITAEKTDQQLGKHNLAQKYNDGASKSNAEICF